MHRHIARQQPSCDTSCETLVTTWAWQHGQRTCVGPNPSLKYDGFTVVDGTICKFNLFSISYLELPHNDNLTCWTWLSLLRNSRLWKIGSNCILSFFCVSKRNLILAFTLATFYLTNFAVSRWLFRIGFLCCFSHFRDTIRIGWLSVIIKSESPSHSHSAALSR